MPKCRKKLEIIYNHALELTQSQAIRQENNYLHYVL